MIACCGIYCTACDIHSAPTNPDIAEKMVKIFVDMGYKDAKPDWFHCDGCRGDREKHWSSNCKILACCVDEKHLENCGQCDDFMCDIITEFANDGYRHHREGIERLKSMRGSKI